MTQNDLLYRFRLRVFAVAAELGNVRAACRAMGIHPSTYYRWNGSWTATAPRSCAPGSAGPRAWPTRPACWSSNG
jgi:transposase-like protein